MVVEFVAIHGGQVSGVGVLEYLGNSRVAIRHLYVRENARGLGYGRQLLAHMTLHAREQGIRELELNTRKIFTAAVTLYESEGWSRVSTDIEDSGPELTYRLSMNRQDG
jgi:GNAT superfamily N-acetyltransferase